MTFVVLSEHCIRPHLDLEVPWVSTSDNYCKEVL